MDKKYIEENEIEIKYLRNQLTPEEVEEFEVYLMENPEFLERLEFDSLLILSRFKGVEKSKGLMRRIILLLSPAVAIVLSIFVVAGAIFTFVPYKSGNELMAVYIVELENSRSSSQLANTNKLYLDKIQQSRYVDLTFFLPEDYPRVEVSLFQVDPRIMTTCENTKNPSISSNVELEESKYSFLVPRSKLIIGDYLVCVSSAEILVNQYRVSAVKE